MKSNNVFYENQTQRWKAVKDSEAIPHQTKTISLSRQVPLLQHETDERVIPHQTKPNSLVILRCCSVVIPHQTNLSLVTFRCANMKLTKEKENTDSMLTILVKH